MLDGDTPGCQGALSLLSQASLFDVMARQNVDG